VWQVEVCLWECASWANPSKKQNSVFLLFNVKFHTMNTQSVFSYLTEEGVRQKRVCHLALKFRTTEHLPYADDSTAVTPKSEMNGGIIVDTPTKIGLRYGHILSLLGRILRTQRLISAFSNCKMQLTCKYCSNTKKTRWQIARLDSESLLSWERLCKEKSPYCYVINLREIFAGNQGEPIWQKNPRNLWWAGSVGSHLSCCEYISPGDSSTMWQYFKAIRPMPGFHYCLKVADSLNEEESLKSYAIESWEPFHVVNWLKLYLYSNYSLVYIQYMKYIFHLFLPTQNCDTVFSILLFSHKKQPVPKVFFFSSHQCIEK
jgi:hypothetical protein